MLHHSRRVDQVVLEKNWQYLSAWEDLGIIIDVGEVV